MLTLTILKNIRTSHLSFNFSTSYTHTIPTNVRCSQDELKSISTLVNNFTTNVLKLYSKAYMNSILYIDCNSTVVCELRVTTLAWHIIAYTDFQNLNFMFDCLLFSTWSIAGPDYFSVPQSPTLLLEGQLPYVNTGN